MHSAGLKAVGGGDKSGSKAEGVMVYKQPLASPAFAGHAPPTYSPSSLRPGPPGRAMQIDDEDNSFMFTSHALGNAPPPPPEACATDEPPRPGEDADAAAAR